jgi:DNA-directed RNA polymerase subunit RPC12/RpoP
MSQVQHSQSNPRDRGVVDCLKCHSPVFIERPGNVAVEFSVPCPKCGHRGMYFKRMMRAENEPVERRQTQRE